MVYNNRDYSLNHSSSTIAARPRSRQIQNNSSLQLAVFHLLEHAGQRLHLLGPVVRLDDSTCREIQRLDSLRPVAYR